MKAKKTVVRTYYKNNTQTFNASDSFQTFTVPSGVTSLSVDCVASKGRDGKYAGGNGGRVQCTLATTPNSTLYIYVGSIPTSTQTASYNASDIRTDNTGVTDNTSLQSRLVVAGGGGNSTSTTVGSGFSGGDGGGLTGGSANNRYSGSGGTQTAGGARGSSGTRYGSDGSFGLGGDGGYSKTYLAGAGGAGWYGGGGGSYSTKVSSGSGGGGSSYTDPSCSSVIHTQGYNNGEGYITISYTTIGTESDYDYYKDSITVEVVKKNNKYYA